MKKYFFVFVLLLCLVALATEASAQTLNYDKTARVGITKDSIKLGGIHTATKSAESPSWKFVFKN